MPGMELKKLEGCPSSYFAGFPKFKPFLIALGLRRLSAFDLTLVCSTKMLFSVKYHKSFAEQKYNVNGEKEHGIHYDGVGNSPLMFDLPRCGCQ